MIVDIVADTFNKTGGLVHNCGQIGYGSFFLLKRVFNIVIHGDEWLKLLRRLKDDGFQIISSLSVGFRFYDQQKYYDAGVEFGDMIKTLLYPRPNLKYRMMLSNENRRNGIAVYIRTIGLFKQLSSERQLARLENGSPSVIEILKEIGLGLLNSLKKVAIAKESMECIK